MENNQEQKLCIEVPEDVADGVYSNLAIISHSTSEFIIDFARLLPGVKKAKVKSRIILTPEHAKRLLLSLQENVNRYERNFGQIKVSAPSHNNPMGGGMGFCSMKISPKLRKWSNDVRALERNTKNIR